MELMHRVMHKIGMCTCDQFEDGKEGKHGGEDEDGHKDGHKDGHEDEHNDERKHKDNNYEEDDTSVVCSDCGEEFENHELLQEHADEKH